MSEYRELRTEDGTRLEGGWRIKDELWKMDDGEYMIEDGGLRIENGGWIIKDLGWRFGNRERGWRQ